MGVHVSNKGIKTANCGLYRDVGHVNIGASGAVGTIYQAGANFITSVTKTATGVYTFQLNQLYPVRQIYLTASIATPAVTDGLATARYRAGSYSATAGTFVIQVSIPTDGTHSTQIAGDPATDSELHFEIDYVAMTTGIAN